MLEIKPFTPSDLDIVTGLAREQDFAPGAVSYTHLTLPTNREV